MGATAAAVGPGAACRGGPAACRGGLGAPTVRATAGAAVGPGGVGGGEGKVTYDKLFEYAENVNERERNKTSFNSCVTMTFHLFTEKLVLVIRTLW